MVRAKFIVDRFTSSLSTQQKDKKGDWSASNTEEVEKRTIVLRAIYSDDPNDENRKFWEATPSGQIELQVINPEAWQAFELGKEYYVDFTLVTKEQVR